MKAMSNAFDSIPQNFIERKSGGRIRYHQYDNGLRQSDLLARLESQAQHSGQIARL